MKTKKNTGSYYTPEFLSKFIVEHVSLHFEGRSYISVLEPSVGNGSFVKAFNETAFPESVKNFSFQAVEKIKSELQKAQIKANTNRKKNTKFSFIKKDFLKYQENHNRKFSLVIGNPPYLKKSLLTKSQVKACEKIHLDAELAKASIKNIWPYFLIRGSELLEQNGIIALILPAEFLQVNFSEQLRKYLIKHFQRTEIFTFDDLLFECKGQDTILLIAYKQHAITGQFYTHIADVNQIKTKNFCLRRNLTLEVNDTKWTHHLLTSDELSFIYNIKKNLQTISCYCDSKPGIVTAANNFFIINRETENLYNLTDHVKPIIQKGFFVNGSVVFNGSEYQKIVNKGNPAKILCISDEEAGNLPANIRRYLQVGVELELPNGYKATKRKNWFVIPNISTAPDAFFFRRVHYYPKLLKNTARVLVTDTAYKVEMRNYFEVNSLVYSFYNSFSLLFAEINGRYYGGGVLELTPKEFKNLPVPYIRISDGEFLKYADSFKNKGDITEILEIYDYDILHESLGLSESDILRIKNIYKKLVLKRLRSHIINKMSEGEE